MPRGEGVWRSLHRWVNPAEEEARELRDDERQASRHSAGQPPVVRISDAADRSLVVVEGVLHSVTLRPRAGVPALEAELRDETGAITLIWLGRRHIHGVQPGVRMRVTGRVGTQQQARIIYNPRYDLRPA